MLAPPHADVVLQLAKIYTAANRPSTEINVLDVEPQFDGDSCGIHAPGLLAEFLRLVARGAKPDDIVTHMTTVRFEQSHQLWDYLHTILKEKEFTPKSISKLPARDVPERTTLTFTVTYASVLDAQKKREADWEAKDKKWAKKKKEAAARKKLKAEKKHKGGVKSEGKSDGEQPRMKKRKTATPPELLADQGLNLLAAGELADLTDFTIPTVTVLTTMEETEECLRQVQTDLKKGAIEREIQLDTEWNWKTPGMHQTRAGVHLLQLCFSYRDKPSRVLLIRMSKLNGTPRSLKAVLEDRQNHFFGKCIKWVDVARLRDGHDITVPQSTDLAHYCSALGIGSKQSSLKELLALTTDTQVVKKDKVTRQSKWDSKSALSAKQILYAATDVLDGLTIYTRAKAKATTAGDRRQAVALQRQFRESNKVDAQDDQGKVKATKSGRTRKTLHDNLKF